MKADLHEAEFAGAAGQAEIGGAAAMSAQDMAPLLAGARAGGMAQAYEMLEIPAIFLDGEGAVLYVGPTALRLIGPHIAVHRRHLVAGSPEANERLQGLIESALTPNAVPDFAILPRGEGLSPLAVHAVPVPGASDNPYQLLKTVLVLDDSAGAAHQGISMLARHIAAGGRRTH